MSAVDDLFRRFASRPAELAARLCRTPRPAQERWRLAAVRWCNLVATASPNPEIGENEQQYELLMAASQGYDVFQALLGPARWELKTYRGESSFEYDSNLLSAMLALWPSRDFPDQYPNRLREWAWSFTRRPMLAHTPLALAERLCTFPEVAYGLLEYPPIGRCAHEIAGDPVLARASLALLRMRLPDYRSVPEDISALEGPSASQYLSHRELRCQLRDVLAIGANIPAHIWPEVDRHLARRPRELEWYNAVALLAASEPHQERAVKDMADHLRVHPQPAHALQLMGYIAGVGRPFTGRGWSRKEIGRKLLPLSRVLLARETWPTAAWQSCLRSELEDNSQATAEQRLDRSFELVKGILGEALLQQALNDSQPIAVRRRAIVAIGLLAPTGDAANLVRALGKLKPHVELRASVTQAQREHRNRSRADHTDPEACLMDALEHVFPSASHVTQSGPEDHR